MNAIEQTDFMSQLREANPQLGRLSSLQLLDQAAEDTEEIGSLADALRIENPEHAHLSSGKLIGWRLSITLISSWMRLTLLSGNRSRLNLAL
jgi:hypothetical protein